MKNHEFSIQIREFFNYFVNELELTNKSKNTIISYRTTINSFIEFLEQYEKDLDFENFKKIDLLNFLEYKNMMLEKHSELKMSSKKLYITHLKTFFTFINENLDTDIKIKTIFNLNIKIPERTPKGIEKDDIEKLEDYMKTLNLESFIGVRNSLILKLLLYSGARRGEVLALRVENFRKDGELYIIETVGKGDKERILYIPVKLIQHELEFYINRNFNHIAITKNNRIMDGSQIYRLLNNIYKKIGIKGSGVHILRHTFAKTMIAKDVNIVTVKELLGHTNIQTTMIYTKPNQKEIQKSYLNSMNLI